MSNFDETVIRRLIALEREVERLRVKERPVGAWQDYSVQWKASGTNPSIGNGILLGRYCKVGKICTVKIFLKGGSTTNWGAGDYTFSLPFTIYGPNGMLCNIGMARIRKPGAGGWTRLIAGYGSFDYLKYFIDITNGTDINTLTPTSPTTLGSGNYIDIQISYEVE